METLEANIQSTLDPDSVTERKHLLIFNHKFGDNSKYLRVLVEPAWGAKNRQHIIITDEKNNVIGIIGGHLKIDSDQLVAFSVDTLANTVEKHTPLHIPRAVGATIIELVSSGIIERWYSSRYLSNDAKKMYDEYLAADKKLTVVPPSAETQFRYVISANPTNR